jgi:hypothetical protein
VVAGFFAVVSVVELERAFAAVTHAQANTAQTAVNAALRISVLALNAKPSLQNENQNLKRYGHCNHP